MKKEYKIRFYGQSGIVLMIILLGSTELAILWMVIILFGMGFEILNKMDDMKPKNKT